jgi:hypothetical protein
MIWLVLYGGDGQRICLGSASIPNKQSRTVDKGCFPSLSARHAANICCPIPQSLILIEKLTVDQLVEKFARYHQNSALDPFLGNIKSVGLVAS